MKAILILLFVLSRLMLGDALTSPTTKTTTTTGIITTQQRTMVSRRPVLLSSIPFISFGALLFPNTHSLALDMDAFANRELQKDKTPTNDKQLSDDESLCRFGQPSKERGDACVRAGMSTQLKKGGVDAYGRVDRGDFVRCKVFYGDRNGKYVRMRQCDDGGPPVELE